MLAEPFSFVDLDLKLEMSIYFHGHAFQKDNVDWFALIKKEYPELEKIVDEYNDEACQVVIPGNKDGDSVIIRAHIYEKEFNESEQCNYPHGVPLRFN